MRKSRPRDAKFHCNYARLSYLSVQAPVAEQVDATDSKSEAVQACGFDSRRAHHSKMEIGVPKVNANMQKLHDLRDSLLADISQRERELDALRNRLKGIDAAIAALSGNDTPPEPQRRNRRNVKQTAMELILEAGPAGVTAHEIVDRAAVLGRQFDRPSVSSLLSRLKREGILSFDGERYRPATSREIENSRTFKVV